MVLQSLLNLVQGLKSRKQHRVIENSSVVRKLKNYLSMQLTEDKVREAQRSYLTYVEQPDYSPQVARRMQSLVNEAIVQILKTHETRKQVNPQEELSKITEKLENESVLQQIPEQVFQNIGEEIGSGGFGSVSRIRNDPLKVIKRVVLPPADHKKYTLVTRELEAYKAINHPSAPKLYGFKIEKDDKGILESAVFLLEYKKGSSPGKLEWNTTTESMLRQYSYVVQIGEVLTHIHKKGFLHRDVKPANTLFSEDASASLIDFGNMVTPVEAQYDFKNAFIMGAPSYLPPETFNRPYNIGSEVYSLASTAFELLTGKNLLLRQAVETCATKEMQVSKLFELRSSRFKVRKAISSSLQGAGINDDSFASFFYKALHPEEEKRYHTVHEFVEGFKEVLSSYFLKQDTSRDTREIADAIRSGERLTARVSDLRDGELLSKLYGRYKKHYSYIKNTVDGKFITNKITKLYNQLKEYEPESVINCEQLRCQNNVLENISSELRLYAKRMKRAANIRYEFADEFERKKDQRETQIKKTENSGSPAQLAEQYECYIPLICSLNAEQKKYYNRLLLHQGFDSKFHTQFIEYGVLKGTDAKKEELIRNNVVAARNNVMALYQVFSRKGYSAKTGTGL